jgi:hypothetical protein
MSRCTCDKNVCNIQTIVSIVVDTGMDETVFMHKLTEKSVQSKRQAASDGLPTVNAGITRMNLAWTSR